MLLFSMFLFVLGASCIYLSFGGYVGIVQAFYIVCGIVCFRLAWKLSPLNKRETPVGDGGSIDHDFGESKDDDCVPDSFYAYGYHHVDTTTSGWVHEPDGQSAYNRITGESVSRNYTTGQWDYSEGDEEDDD